MAVQGATWDRIRLIGHPRATFSMDAAKKLFRVDELLTRGAISVQRRLLEILGQGQGAAQ